MVFNSACYLIIWKPVVAAGEDVVSVLARPAANQQIRELQRLLNKKTMEVDIQKKTVTYDQVRKWATHSPLWPKKQEIA